MVVPRRALEQMQVRETQQTKVGLGENDMPVMVVSDIYFKMFASTWGK